MSSVASVASKSILKENYHFDCAIKYIFLSVVLNVTMKSHLVTYEAYSWKFDYWFRWKSGKTILQTATALEFKKKNWINLIFQDISHPQEKKWCFLNFYPLLSPNNYFLFMKSKIVIFFHSLEIYHSSLAFQLLYWQEISLIAEGKYIGKWIQ